jgi:hypothetical protein
MNMPIDIQGLPGTGNNAIHRTYSNFFADNHVIQNVAIVQPKNLLIDILRQHFSLDNIFTYRADEYGFPLTPNLTGLNVDDILTTKILISDVFRYEVKFYPAITVKTSGGSSLPVSFNQEGTIKYRKDLVENNYGGVSTILTPTHKVYAGAWDMSFDISIHSESHAELEEITEIVMILLQYVSWNELRANGLFIKTMRLGGENSEPYANDYIFSHTLSIETRSEWRVEIPVENVVEKIVFYFDVDRHFIPGQTTQADVQALKYDDVVDMAEIVL